MAIDYTHPAPTKIDIRPDRRDAETAEISRPLGRFSVQKATQGDGKNPFGEEGFVANLIDVINPLQHIPVISDIYRSITGDQISPGAKLAGGILLGGGIGFAASAASMMFEQANGGVSPMAKIASAITGSPTPATQQLAQAKPVAEAKPLQTAAAQHVELPWLNEVAAAPQRLAMASPRPVAIIDNDDAAELRRARPVATNPVEGMSQGDEVLQIFDPEAAASIGKYRQTQILSDAQRAQLRVSA